MDIEELRAEITAIVDPEPDPDLPVRDIPHPRLRGVHGLDDSYLAHAGYAWEGSTVHPHTRICPADEDRLHTLTRNSERVLVDQEDGTKARLKIHDHPVVGGYLILLKKRRA
jgi:hypothetical protein